jgi:3',5'-cyclic AMP phosphodiesterase CpdA
MRVILVSDTHLSPSAAEAQANWEAVLRYVAAAAPDVVLHLGDLTQDGARSADELHHGRRQLDRLPVAWRAVPGNHDIGDNPWPGAPDGSVVDSGRRQRWLDIVGADHWSLSTDGWTLLAINAQLLGSGGRYGRPRPQGRCAAAPALRRPASQALALGRPASQGIRAQPDAHLLPLQPTAKRGFPIEL